MSDSFENLRVLIVDPNRHMRGLVAGVLHAFSFRDVREVADAADAFNEWKSFPADIVITEFDMSPLDGLDFVRLIRTGKDSPNPHVPVIMLTSYTEMKNVMAARDVGVTEFLSKPISAQSLYARINSVISKPRPFVTTKSYFGPDRRRRQIKLNEGGNRRATDQEPGNELSSGDVDELLTS